MTSNEVRQMMYQSPYKGFNSWGDGIDKRINGRINPPIRGSIAGLYDNSKYHVVSIPL